MSRRGFEIVRDEFRKHPLEDIKLPVRGTSRSACYDICTPVKIIIPPYGISEAVQTDIKSYMEQDEVLVLHVRSSIGFKKNCVLVNCTGIIDSDYYENLDNDGNIGFRLKNLSNKEVVIEAGERIMQGMFIKYLVAEHDIVLKEDRTGGIGSTGK